MNINLQIEQIVLDGIDLGPSQRADLQAEVAAELSRLVKANGLPPHLQEGGIIPTLSAKLNLTENLNPSQMGQQIAQSIYQGMDTK
jgi:hypothetical protein